MAHYEGVSRSARLGIARNSHGALRTAITHVWSTRPRGTRITHAHCARNIRTEHYPGGAMGTSRPTAITPAMPHGKFAGLLRTRNSRVSRGVRTARAPWCGPVACAPRVRPLCGLMVRSRCGRARCPHRAAAPDGAVRGVASCEIRARGTHRHYARPLRTQYSHSALPGRRDGDIAPYRHYARPCHTENSRDHYTREIRQRCKACRGTRPLRTRIAQAKFACGVRAAITQGGGTGRATGGEEGETSVGRFPIPVEEKTENQTLIRG